MSKVISPFYYQGEIDANASKSYLQRALLISAFASGKSVLSNYQENNDSLAVMRCLTQLGATFRFLNSTTVEVTPISNLKESKLKINVCESGLALRMLGTFLSVLVDDLTIDGEGTLLKREQKALIYQWQQLGYEVEHNDFKLPIHKKGNVKTNNIIVDASDTSQVLSGLLIALPYLNGSNIEIQNLTSKPYIEMTLDIMGHFGVAVKNNNQTYYLEGTKKYTSCKYEIESDWSGIANHIIGAAISGNIKINNVHYPSKQADAIILDVIKNLGIQYSFSENTLKVKKLHTINPFQFDIKHCPDLFPVLVILALACNGKSTISGIGRLQNKESNRLETMKTIIENSGAKFEIVADSISIEHLATSKNEISVETYNDHRIAMAGSLLAIFGLTVLLDNEECVRKSYPTYFNDLNKISSCKLGSVQKSV